MFERLLNIELHRTAETATMYHDRVPWNLEEEAGEGAMCAA